MRSVSLWLGLMLIAGGARAAGNCPATDDVRSQAECIHDQMPADVMDRLYRLALSTVKGKLDPDDVPADFLYVAEEAGEAARRKGPKPLVEMARSNDVSKLAFAARAITAYLDAVRRGTSHRDRFENDGDPKLYADAKRILRPSCKRLAANDNAHLNAEGTRCLDEIAPPSRLPPVPADLEAELGGLRGTDLKISSNPRGGLRASSPNGARTKAPAPSKPAP